MSRRRAHACAPRGCRQTLRQNPRGVDRAGGRAGHASGFTLMETLVMLVLVGLAVGMMFQMLGGYRIAAERAAAQAGGIDRATLMDAWFRSSVNGLHPTEDVMLTGDAAGFSAATLNPLFGAPGRPTPLRWELEPDTGRGPVIRYLEDGAPRFDLPLRAARTARFGYLDETGRVHDRWPPGTGLQGSLPAAIALLAGEGERVERLRVASVLGPLMPRIDPFQVEDE